jgi:isoquinoline 1-oxidoreductase subunit beta
MRRMNLDTTAGETPFESDELDLSRRRLLRQGAVASALILCASWSHAAGRDERRRQAATGMQGVNMLTAWIRIAQDGSVTLIASQSEMGQGITTTLAAALADELYLPWKSVRIEQAPFAESYRDPVYNWMFTGNSQGTSSFYSVMRKMGAAAREMLLTAAGQRLGVKPATLSIQDGVIRHAASSRSLKFGEVAADAARLPVPTNPQLRPDPVLAGQSLPRLDIPSKVDGSAVFGIDVKVPGMLLASVRCAPRFGARLSKYDAEAIRAQPGVVALVEVPNGLAVVARTYLQAKRALDSAQLTWSNEGSSLSCSSKLPAVYYEKLTTGPFFTHKNAGMAIEAGRRLEATYEIPFQAHATMEPMNCTAHVSRERCEIWAPTQGMEMAQNVAMQVTGLPGDRITIHRTMLGGGFGRRLLADFLKQTLIVAMAVKEPVKLIWSREEDMTHDFYRPAMLHRVSGTIDASGALAALEHRVVSPSHMLYIIPRGLFPQVKDWTAAAAPPEKIDTMAVEGLLDVPYEIPRQRVEQHRLELDIPVSVWRTTGHGPNNFVLESFIDELAHAASVDPFTFRRRALSKDPRAVKLLAVLEEKSGWSEPVPKGTGRGLALAKAFGAYAAAAVRLTVKDSAVKIERIVMVVDCGRTLDPGIATSNILGGIVWGLSGMKTGVTFEQGSAVQTNFPAFDPLHLRETPPCDVHFIESGAALGGTGELGPVPIHAAVCNAIFAATGKRVRSLPLYTAGLSFA